MRFNISNHFLVWQMRPLVVLIVVPSTEFVVVRRLLLEVLEIAAAQPPRAENVDFDY